MTNEEKNSRQKSGGTLEIPDGWCVVAANFDSDEPYIIIQTLLDSERRLSVPKSLAYYLSTHSCGSEEMRKLIRFHAETELQNKIKEALGL